MTKISIISTIGSVILLIVVVGLTRQRRIRERYALNWLALGVLILVFSLFRGLLDLAARAVGIYYAPSLLLILAIFFGMVIGIHFTMVLSRLTDSNKKLVQEVGLLKNRVEHLERSRIPIGSTPIGPGA
jgi:hypothetical protein